MVIVFRCSELLDGSNRTVDESNRLPRTTPSVAENSGPRRSPPHWPGVKFAAIVASSPAQISGVTCRLPVGARYGRTFTVPLVVALLYSGAVAERPITYDPGSLP